MLIISRIMIHTDYPAYAYNKYKTSPFFLISLEAWRRGLVVAFSRDIKNFTVSSAETTCIFSKSMVLDPEMGFRTHEICETKDETKQYLARAGVPVARGRRFRPEIGDEVIVGYASEVGYPVVLKPTNGFKGKGVFSNIPDSATLRKMLVVVRRDMNYPDVMLEERVEGHDYRVFVIADRVEAALKRVPAHVTGNGRDPVRKLIKSKNAERMKNPHLEQKLIKMDPDLLNNIRNAGKSLRSVPKEGEILFLRVRGNVSTGGDSEDVTERLPKHVGETAIRAVKAIPGLNHAGVDVLYDEKNPDSPGVVIEINSMAEFGGHLYPVIGEPRDISSALIDHYFPESVGRRDKNRSVFYDLDDLRNTLENNPETEVTLPSPPEGEWVRREIILSERVQKTGFCRWAKKQALVLGLSGFVENQPDGSIRIVVGGGEEPVRTFEHLCGKGPQEAGVVQVASTGYDKPIIVGFRIIRKQSAFRVKTAHLVHAVRWRLTKLKSRFL